jgi:hypothetical protein
VSALHAGVTQALRHGSLVLAEKRLMRAGGLLAQPTGLQTWSRRGAS